MAGKIHIGTSGWSYSHWLGTFYPTGTKTQAHLDFYVRYFSTVEINNSFYRLPERKTFSNWKNSVPEDFLFVVKANRFITHMKKLIDPAASIYSFMENVTALEEKLGPILFQLPPNWKLNIQRFEEFLSALPRGMRYVFEFRNESWYTAEIYALLQRYNCAFCMYELGGHTSPILVTADFVYLRLHGPGEKYQGSYPDQTLDYWSDQCMAWSASGDVFVYFDNDQNGYAPKNAQRMIELIARKK